MSSFAPRALDARIREIALTHVESLIARHGDVLQWEQIAQGIMVDGRKVALASKACGIHQPAWGCLGALTAKTTVPRRGRKRWYDDVFDDRSAVFEYRYQGTRPDSHANRAMRACMRERLPIIYLRGVAPARYAPYICFVVHDSPKTLTFTLAPAIQEDLLDSSILQSAAIRPLPIERRYAVRQVEQRLHQSGFREMVLDAYRCRCAICRLGHRNLLDAAHIIDDRDPDGLAVLPNGLALCKLHHAAYDADLLGITPDLEVRVAPQLLSETDGPVLEHGLKGVHRTRLSVPRARRDRPDAERLERRWLAVPWR
jgi:putative restriction endonuclease